ncbi:MAG: lipase family protein, partial [Betaproteobacteria bacterium]
NLPAASGLTLAAQVVDAARFYLDVRKTYPGADVSFTGHSLGGGLASLMAVFFDKPAHVFDQAPFEATAKSASVVAELKTALSKDYALQALAPEFLSYQAGSTHKAREYRVQLTYVDGEILRDFPAYLAIAGAVFGPGGALALGGMALLAASEIAGPSPHVVSPGGNGVSPLTRHDSRLLAALLLSPPLLSATQANADFLQEVFKSPLFTKRDYAGDQRNFLSLMVQGQVAGNQNLDRLAEDIGKFTGALDPVASGVQKPVPRTKFFVPADAQLKGALYQLAIALYFGETEKRVSANDSTPLESVFKTVTGGIQFAPDAARSAEYGDALKKLLSEMRLYSDFSGLKYDSDPPAERYTLPTSGGMNVSAPADGKRDVMLGSRQADTLSAGDGNDILIGGKGTDTLIGGAGNDTYVINSGDGADTIIDSGGGNRVLFNGKPVVDAFIKGDDGKYHSLDTRTGYTISINSPAVLALEAGTSITFSNQTTVAALNAMQSGLRLIDKATPVTPTLTLAGDLKPEDADPNTPKIDLRLGALGNVVVTPTAEPDRADTLYGSAGSDLIQGKGGDDDLYGRGGADRLEGGGGRDAVEGGMGNDLLAGNSEADILDGGDGNDRIFGNAEVELTKVDEQTGGGTGRDLLIGGEGEDTLVGGATADVLLGGAADDVILGGAGDDDLWGDYDATGAARVKVVVASVMQPTTAYAGSQRPC